jgi:hypothetical protein
MKNLIAIFFSITMLLPTLLSCAEDNPAVSETENLQTKVDYQGQIRGIMETADAVKATINNSRNPIPDPLDQATVDYYAAMAGISPGVVTVEDVLNIVDAYGIATQEGLAEFLENQGFSELTLLTIEELTSGNWIHDLEGIQGFNELNLNEKELLQLANNYVLWSQNNPESCDIGAFYGIIIGGALCTPWCAIVGAIIGCIGGASE